jgi:hypothetical protein
VPTVRKDALKSAGKMRERMKLISLNGLYAPPFSKGGKRKLLIIITWNTFHK